MQHLRNSKINEEGHITSLSSFRLKSPISNKRNNWIYIRLMILCYLTSFCLVHILVYYFLCNVTKHVLCLQSRKLRPKVCTLMNRAIEYICRQKVTHNKEVGPKRRKIKLNLVLKKYEYDDKMPTSSEWYKRPIWSDHMRWRLVTKLTPWGYF
jgi:hypothetical protein